jgi:DNA-binding CsgD family transcriptional regulator
MSRRNDEERARDAAQARARRLRRKLAAVVLHEVEIVDCHGGFGARSEFGTQPRHRELEILAEVCQHGGIQQAAYCLKISYSTAKNNLSSLYQRLGAVSIPHALLLLGWIDVPSRARRPHRLIEQVS